MQHAREVPDKVKRDRREILDADRKAVFAAAKNGDGATAKRITAELEALQLLVPDENGNLVTGPDVAD